jgi:hypothetical protein
MNKITTKTPSTGPRALLARLALLSSATLLIASLFAVGFRAPGQTGQYDPEESKAKLMAIGAALKIYRIEYCDLPVEQWQSPSDAGLPPNILVLGQPGHSWSVADGLHAFKLSGVIIPMPADAPLDFAHSYPSAGFNFGVGSIYEGFTDILRERGTRMPVIADLHYMGLPQFESDRGWKHAIVLRMDGTVDTIRYRAGDPLEVFRN